MGCNIHCVENKPSGAICSCGREFNVWKHAQHGYRTSNDIARQVNLARANASRHANAANTKECSCD